MRAALALLLLLATAQALQRGKGGDPRALPAPGMRGTGLGPRFQRFLVASLLPACSQTAGQHQRGKGRGGRVVWDPGCHFGVMLEEVGWGEDRATGIGSFSL